LPSDQSAETLATAVLLRVSRIGPSAGT